MFVVHPLLFALFPVVLLYSQNMDQFPARVLVKPLLWTLAGTGLVWAVGILIFGGLNKGALFASLAVTLWCSYGHCVTLIRGFRYDIAGRAFGPHHLIMPSFGVALLGGAYLLWKTRMRLDNLGRILNVTAGCLVLIPLVQIAVFQFKTGGGPPRHHSKTAANIPRPKPPVSNPDIYYIILDGYAREDILSSLYDYDNGPFVNYLAEKGFFVAEKAMANYNQTGLSLASSLNMAYLDELVSGFNPESNDRQPLAQLIADSEVIRFLKRQGYRFVAFSSGYFLTDIESADVYFTSDRLDEFERGVLATTPLAAGDLLWHKHRERIKFTFDHLPDVTTLEGPLFVIAHIPAPHPPFVFGPTGEEITPEGEFKMDDGSHLIGPGMFRWSQYRSGYVRQIEFVNARMRQLIDAILDRSDSPPVIVIQADHGPGSLLNQDDPSQTYLKERFAILNAYYLPGVPPQRLYPTISPVNTFRVLLNEYFGVKYPLLEDRCCFAAWLRPFKAIPVSDMLEAEDDSKLQALIDRRLEWEHLEAPKPDAAPAGGQD